MVIGNPYRFAFVVDLVPEWNMEGSLLGNGIFFVCIDGELFPKKIDCSSLTTVFAYFFGYADCEKSALISMPVNDSLFKMDKRLAFTEMYKAMNPGILDDNESDDSTYTYLVSNSMSEIQDRGAYIFAVSDGEMLRVLAGYVLPKMENGEVSYFYVGRTIKEIFISVSEMNILIEKLHRFSLENVRTWDKQ
jgi:hypothetical protein